VQPPPAADDDEPHVFWSQVARFQASLDAGRIERGGTLDPALLGQAADLGLFAVSLPAQYGGLDLGLWGACRLVSKLAEADRAVATSVGLHAGLGSRAITRFGSEALKARYLPAMAEGRIVGSFAATEPGAGSDLMAARTTGVLQDGKIRIDGEKCYVTNGGFAKVFTVLVKTPGIGGRRSHCLVCVPRDAPGVHVGPEEHKMGIRASSTVTVRFDAVMLPLDHVLKPEGEGMAQAHEVLQWGRTLMSAGCVGTARTALAMTLEHVQQRTQFGRTLSRFEAVQAQVAAMAAELAAMESLVEATARGADRGEPIARRSLESKVFCSEGAFSICDRALQLHGALGFIEDTGVARLLRDCRVTRIFEGANDVLLLHHGTALVSARGPDAPPAGERSPAIRGPALAGAEHDLAERVASLRSTFGVRVIHQQLRLQAVARADIALRAVGCLLQAVTEQGAASRDVASLAAQLLARRAQDALAQGEHDAQLQPSAAAVFDALTDEGDAVRGSALRSADGRNPPLASDSGVAS